MCVSQVMVFVHARNATVKTAMGLIEMAKNHGETRFFQSDQGPDYGQCEKQVYKICYCLCLNIFLTKKNFMLFQFFNGVFGYAYLSIQCVVILLSHT